MAKASVTRIDGDRVAVEILEMEDRRRLKPELIVYQGAAKGQKVDDAIERLAELGVAEVWVYESERSVVHWNKEKVDRLTRRWRAIARSASKQSRNPFMLRAGGGLSWTELLRRLSREPSPSSCGRRERFRCGRPCSGGRKGSHWWWAGRGSHAGRGRSSGRRRGPGRVAGTADPAHRERPVVAASAVLYHYGLIG